LYNCLGAITFYAILFVVITSYFRPRLGNRRWKPLHYVAYAAAAFLFAHSILIDPNLKNLPPDLIDGEKVLLEGCLLLVMTASIWRMIRPQMNADKRK
jgi:DMSO/TMAO reductase YedYZ heme-binding membrane subunit